jgi:hypothetical protein
MSIACKKEPPELRGALGYLVLAFRLGSGSPGPNDEDNDHYRQRGTNTDYGVDPDGCYLLRRWDIDHRCWSLFHHYWWRRLFWFCHGIEDADGAGGEASAVLPGDNLPVVCLAVVQRPNVVEGRGRHILTDQSASQVGIR